MRMQIGLRHKWVAGMNAAARRMRRGVVLAALATALVGCAQSAVYAPVETHTRPGRLSAAAKTLAVAIADLDNDGSLDVVAGAGEPGAITISYGDGAGGLVETQTLAVEGMCARGAGRRERRRATDIIYSVQRQSSGVRIMLNQGGRRWKPGKVRSKSTRTRASGPRTSTAMATSTSWPPTRPQSSRAASRSGWAPARGRGWRALPRPSPASIWMWPLPISTGTAGWISPERAGACAVPCESGWEPRGWVDGAGAGQPGEFLWSACRGHQRRRAAGPDRRHLQNRCAAVCRRRPGRFHGRIHFKKRFYGRRCCRCRCQPGAGGPARGGQFLAGAAGGCGR